MSRPWRNIAIVLFTCGLVAGGLYGKRSQALTEEAKASMKLYTELLNAAHENYGEEVQYQDLVHASINGMVRTLDPHTSFLPPRAYDGMRERQRSSFYGLGILVGSRNGRVTVVTPIEGGPAFKLGVRAGDIIDTIDGESTESMVLNDAVGLLKGPKGTTVDITILRRGMEKPIPMTVVRAEIPLTTVRYAYMMTPDVGYMRVTDFNRGTGREVAEAIKDLKGQGMERLLLDLRNNGGGLLDQAIEVGDQFVPEGSKIVETRGRSRNSQQTFFSEERYEHLNLPVVTLVNSGTASAAEILAGAIQDHDVGIIAGTPTWGKGLVQTVYSLSYGAGLALTTAKYYTPAGRLIQRDYSSFYDYYSYDGSPADAELLPERGPGDLAEETDLTDAQVFLTDLGREVRGGGGITPDVVVEAQEIAPFLQLLHSRSSFFEFAVDVFNRQQIKSETWRPDDKVLAEFKTWLLKQEVASDEDIAEGLADPEILAYARRQIRAEVANAGFGQNAWHRVLAEGDTQIQEGLELFSQAETLLASRKTLDREKDQKAQLNK